MPVFDRAVNRLIAPRLKEWGFARHHNSWNRRSLWVTEIIELQQSRSNTALGARFTINLGIAFRPWPTSAWLKPHDCRFHRRIGQLRPDGQDHWYRYRPRDEAETERAVREALADIEAYVPAFFAAAPGGPEPAPLRWLRRRIARGS